MTRGTKLMYYAYMLEGICKLYNLSHSSRQSNKNIKKILPPKTKFILFLQTVTSYRHEGCLKYLESTCSLYFYFYPQYYSLNIHPPPLNTQNVKLKYNYLTVDLHHITNHSCKRHQTQYTDYNDRRQYHQQIRFINAVLRL